jgi:hypothetical protein
MKQTYGIKSLLFVYALSINIVIFPTYFKLKIILNLFSYILLFYPLQAWKFP